MRTEAVLPGLAEIEGLRERIELWRRGRPKKCPMPEELWQEARAAAKRLGTGRVARALGLGYEGLKQRVLSKSASHGRGAHREAAARTQFVEMTGAAVLGASAGREEMVVEIVAADGTKLTVRLNDGANPDWAALINALRGRT